MPSNLGRTRFGFRQILEHADEGPASIAVGPNPSAITNVRSDD
jgi:hypothetical protein